MVKRRNFSSDFKTKVSLVAIRGKGPVAELAARFKVHPNMIAKVEAHGGALLDYLDRTCKAYNRRPSGCELTPLGQGVGPGLFEIIAAVETALVVEVVVN